MLTLFYGDVGSGKTYAMVESAMRAYERGEPVFANIDIDPSGWKAKEGSSFTRWYEPIDLIELVDGLPTVRCGTVLFDELGAIVNNRESDYWPFMLTVKLIEHRKDHLDFFATAQVDDMADKNMRRFYNRVFKCSMMKLPLLGYIRKGSQRSALACPWPDCTKNGGVIFPADRRGWGTVYRCKDIDPRRTANITKHNSKGSRWLPFNPKVANAYGSAKKVSEEAQRWHDKAMTEWARRKAVAARYPQKRRFDKE